jgi:hypothetical protein
MINDLIKLATHLDNKGLQREADYLDAVIKNATGGSQPGMEDVDKFISDVATTYSPELSAARNVLVNKVGEVLEEKGWAGFDAAREGGGKLKYMWDQMKNERMRAPEYAALYWYLSSLYGADTITADFGDAESKREISTHDIIDIPEDFLDEQSVKQ